MHITEENWMLWQNKNLACPFKTLTPTAFLLFTEWSFSWSFISTVCYKRSLFSYLCFGVSNSSGTILWYFTLQDHIGSSFSGLCLWVNPIIHIDSVHPWLPQTKQFVLFALRKLRVLHLIVSYYYFHFWPVTSQLAINKRVLNVWQYESAEGKEG